MKAITFKRLCKKTASFVLAAVMIVSMTILVPTAFAEQTKTETAPLHVITTVKAAYSVGNYKVTTQGGNLNLRPNASSSGNPIGSVPNGTIVYVTEFSNGFGKTTYNGQTGWLSMDYLTFVSGSTTTDTSGGSNTTSYTPGTYRVTTQGGNLNLRSSPSSSAAAPTTVPNGTLVVVTEFSNGFGKTTYGGYTGWMSMDYLTFVSSSTTTTTDTSGGTTSYTPGTYKVTTQGGNLNLRSSASSNAAAPTTVPNGTLVVVTEFSNGFGKTTYNGYTGWLSMSYLTFVSGNTTPTTDTSSQPTSQLGTYRVNIESGTLNFRATASSNGTRIGGVPKDTLVYITEISNGFGKTVYNGQTGWLSMSYLVFVSSSQTTTDTSSPQPTGQLGTYRVNVSSGGLWMRASASSSGAQLTIVPKDTLLVITEISNGFGKSTYGGYTGWLSMSYLAFVSSSTTITTDTSSPQPSGQLGIYRVNIESGTLNFRATASSNGTKIGSIPKDTLLTITEISNGFGKTVYNGQTGWVSMSYMAYVGQSSDTPVQQETGYYKVTLSSGNLTLRSSASSNGDRLGLVPNGTVVKITEISNGYGKTTYAGQTGWLSMIYLTKTDNPQDNPNPQGNTYTVTTSATALNIRATASASGQIIGSVPKGTVVTVTETSNGFGKITYGSTTGWVSMEYLTATSGGGENNGPKLGTYRVNIESGTLNFRATPSSNGTRIDGVPKDTLLVITEISNGFGKAIYKGQTGWVSMGYMAFVSDSTDTVNTNSDISGYTTGTYQITTEGGNLKLRAAPINGSQLALIPNGTILQVTEVSGAWGKTTYNGQTGWISLDLAKKVSGQNGENGSETGYALGSYTVTLSSGNLRMRSEPSASADPIDQIPNGTKIVVTEINDGFGKTTYNGKTGWVSMAYLSFNPTSEISSDYSPEIDPEVNPGGEVSPVGEVALTYVVNTEDNSAVKIYNNANESSAVLGTIPNGTTIIITGSQNDFGYTSYNGTNGWVAMKFLTNVAENEVNAGTLCVIKTLDILGSVKLHKEPSSSSEVLTKIPNGTEVILQEKSGMWAKVSYNNMTGWVMKLYLSKGIGKVADKINEKVTEIIEQIKDTDYQELLEQVKKLIKGGDDEVTDDEVVPDSNLEVVDNEVNPDVVPDPEKEFDPYGPAESKAKYGDVNCDGYVNMEDITSLQRIIADLTNYTSFGAMSRVNADANHDGGVNMEDVTTIQKYLAQLISTLDDSGDDMSVG
ncbi:MAG: SH3 domain-containing protein [Clostridiales bacterium]|nr:SH3 domain-containing protein [Clostridiales bacterium]